MVNLRRHLDNVRDVYGIPCVVAVNRFPTDTDRGGRQGGRAGRRPRASRAFPATHFADGGTGAQDLAEGRARGARRSRRRTTFSFTYDDDLSLTAKVEAIATRLYGAGLVTWDAKARAGCCASSGTATAGCRSAWPRRSTRSRPTRPRWVRRRATSCTCARSASRPAPASWWWSAAT